MWRGWVGFRCEHFRGLFQPEWFCESTVLWIVSHPHSIMYFSFQWLWKTFSARKSSSHKIPAIWCKITLFNGSCCCVDTSNMALSEGASEQHIHFSSAVLLYITTAQPEACWFLARVYLRKSGRKEINYWVMQSCSLVSALRRRFSLKWIFESFY